MTLALERGRRTKRLRHPIDKLAELRANGEGLYRANDLVRVLFRTQVLDYAGNVYSPTKNAMLELLKWHAGGGRMVAVPMSKLAMELSCSQGTVSRLIRGLESEGLVRRYRRHAPGNLYTIEILEPVPEPAPDPLAPVQEQMLQVLRERMDENGIVQTNEHELALALDVSHETVMVELMRLRRLGYVSSTMADYGRPCIIKVLHDHPVSRDGDGRTITVVGYCMKCRTKKGLRNPRLFVLEGVRGHRRCVEGQCPDCGTKIRTFVPSSFGGGRPEEDEKVVRFLEWQREVRRQEQEKLDQLLRSVGGRG